MSKFTDMFNKSIRAEIEFIDLDNGEAKLDKVEGKGKQNAPIDYDPSDKIEEFTNEGYELASNDLDINGVKPTYDDDGHIYYISFHHGTTVADADYPAYGYSSDQLAMKVTQTVHYEGASTRTPIDSKLEMDVHKRLVVDRVNGKIIKDSHWQDKFSNFKLIATPIVPGFVADQAVVGGKAINVFHPNETYTVKYELNEKPVADQTVKIEYVDILDDNKVIATDEVKGKANMPISYDAEAKIAALGEQGFDLVDNSFNGDGNVQFFGDNEQVPVFVITMKHNYALVNEKHPLDGVDKKEYSKEISFSVNFTGAGDKIPKPKKQTAVLTRSLFVMPKNKNIVGASEWKSRSDVDGDKKADSNFAAIKVDPIDGYTVSATKNGQSINITDNEITSSKLPALINGEPAQDITVKVTYTKDGATKPGTGQQGGNHNEGGTGSQGTGQQPGDNPGGGTIGNQGSGNSGQGNISGGTTGTVAGGSASGTESTTGSTSSTTSSTTAATGTDTKTATAASQSDTSSDDSDLTVT